MLGGIKWSLLLPNSERVINLLKEHPYHFLSNWWSTFSVSAIASVLALSLALLIAIPAIRFRLIDILFIPFVALSQSFPLQAIAPLLIIVLGIGFQTKATIAFIIAFFPIYGTCLTALKTTPKPILANLSICNCSFLKGVWYIRIPSALPSIVSSAKIGFTLAVLGAVVAEFIHPDKGLGYLLLLAQSNYDVDVIYICLCILIFQGIFVYGTLSILESILIRRREG